jgi:TnpA family transposase
VQDAWFAAGGLTASDQRPDRTGKALREYGRLIESNFVLRWSGDPDMR